jgi:hypothetical protein
MRRNEIKEKLDGLKVRLDNVELIPGREVKNPRFVEKRKEQDIGKIYEIKIVSDGMYFYYEDKSSGKLTISLPRSIESYKSIIDGDEGGFAIETEYIMFYVSKV